MHFGDIPIVSFDSKTKRGFKAAYYVFELTENDTGAKKRILYAIDEKINQYQKKAERGKPFPLRLSVSSYLQGKLIEALFDPRYLGGGFLQIRHETIVTNTTCRLTRGHYSNPTTDLPQIAKGLIVQRYSFYVNIE